MRKGRDGEKNGKKTGGEKKEKEIRMKIVATTSLPAVDRPKADRWNAARSRQYTFLTTTPLIQNLFTPKQQNQIFWTNKFLDSNFLLTYNSFWTQIFWSNISFGHKVSLGPKIFRTQNFFRSKILFRHKIFWAQHLFGSKIHFRPKFFFRTQNFFRPNFFLT